MHKLVHSLPHHLRDPWFIVHRLKKVTINHEPSTTNRKSKGFTLIEILVVVAIMAVLAGGLLYSTNNAREKGKDARRKDDLKALSTALVGYYTDHNKYPPTNSGDPLDYVSDAASPWIPDLTPYLNKFPKDPLQASIFAPLAAVFENGKKIASGSLAWLTTNQIDTQKPKGQVAGTTTFGNSQTTGGAYDCCNGGELQGSKFTMGASYGTVSSMSVYINGPVGSNKYVLAIYSDWNGGPGNVLTNSSVANLTTGPGWNTLPVTPITLYAKTTYWLMYSTDGASGNNPYWTPGSGRNSYFTGYTLGTTFPVITSWSSGQFSTSIYTITATYTPISGMWSGTIQSSADDAKRWRTASNPTGTYENTIPDNPQGTPYNCPDIRENYFRFSNVGVPANATISHAYLTFSPNQDSGAKGINAGSTSTFQSNLSAENAADPSAITDGNSTPANQFQTKIGNLITPPIPWDHIGPWEPIPAQGGANQSNDIATIIQPLVKLGGWNGSTNHINIFWLDNGTAGCVGSTGQGRSGISYDGAFPLTGPSLGTPPRLIIIYSTTPPPSTCTDPAATNFGRPLPCTYPPPPTTGACDNKDPANVYCLRTSANQKVFVLWAKLENANDSQIYTNTNGNNPCNLNDFTSPSSPFIGLNSFYGSTFNYCIKSPQ